MDVIALIEKDHDRVEELFRRFKGGGGLTGLVRRATGTVPARQRRSALEGICRELDVHARVEEEIVYPAIRATGDPELGKMVTESLREHAGVKKQVADLRGRPEGDDLEERVSRLEGDVQHHVSEEERDMLPRVRDLIDERQRAQLGRRVQSRKRALMGRRPARRSAARKASAAKARGRKRARTRGRRAS